MHRLGNSLALELMDLHMSTLFCYDPDGRLRSVNELGKPLAPRFFMGRTHQGNRWRFRHDLPTATIAHLDRLCRSEPISSDLATPSRNEASIRQVLHDLAPVAHEYRGPAYWIAEDTQPAAPVALIGDANAELVEFGFPWLLELIQTSGSGPIAAAIERGRAVAVCFCARLPIRATEAGVETLPAARGKGYATAAVAAWAAEVRRQGFSPLYSTSWENLASQAIARKLQMVCYGEDWWIL